MSSYKMILTIQQDFDIKINPSEGVDAGLLKIRMLEYLRKNPPSLDVDVVGLDGSFSIKSIPMISTVLMKDTTDSKAATKKPRR